MSYTALYRKYRPTQFEDVKGQDAIVKTLKNQIKLNRTSHAYLFCGTRGTGKTTVAKILAKAVNCENPQDGNPCGECPTCKSIADGTSMNVIEIDAASNNGVDNIREIIDEVSYSPATGKYKVYIIDEVHMITTSAFNALLKTLEEPPSYVIFILATTEVNALPVTILSRCQRYDFKRIPVDTITERLKELMAGENIEAEDKALKYIAKMADGALRDAISLFDQCNAFYFGQPLTYDNAINVLGSVDPVVFSQLLRYIIADNLKSAIKSVEDAIMQGRDLQQFVKDFIWYLRNLLMLKNAFDDDMSDIIDMSSENVARLKEEADLLDQETIMRFIRVFSQLSSDIKYSSQKRVLIEIAIVKLCRPSMETDTESLLDRIRKVENLLESGAYVTRTVDATQVEDTTPEEKVELPPGLSEDVKQACERKNEILDKVCSIYREFLIKSRWTATADDRISIVVRTKQSKVFLEKETAINDINNAIQEVMQKKIDFEIVFLEREEKFEKHFTEIIPGINMKIVQED